VEEMAIFGRIRVDWIGFRIDRHLADPYVLQTGRITKHGSADELLESDGIRKAFLGI
jgi:ABC-type branched-subunit amino acid transport system ATPase component